MIVPPSDARIALVVSLAAALRVAVEPEAWQREPREGWPVDGWYRVADGWPDGHDPKRRGWCVVSDRAPKGAP